MDLSGICGWSPTRACPRLGPGGLVSPNSSMATQLGVPWSSARRPLHSRGCPRDGHHRSLWHSRVVAHSRTRPVAAGWTCVAQQFDGHPIGDTMAWCNKSDALARMPWGWSLWISLAFAGGRQPAHARVWGPVDSCRPTVRWPRSWGYHGVVHEVHCTRVDALGKVNIDLSGIGRSSPTRACPRLGRGGLVSPNSSMATQLGAPWRGARGPLHSC